jgi:hypothetical protein
MPVSSTTVPMKQLDMIFKPGDTDVDHYVPCHAAPLNRGQPTSVCPGYVRVCQFIGLPCPGLPNKIGLFFLTRDNILCGFG